ncbi:hypothetical protein BGZ73_003034 [Actinomortierella ambigua]|nr:hypothetical protein BGZ73_003034 [Actinomortierella ambigua]
MAPVGLTKVEPVPVEEQMIDSESLSPNVQPAQSKNTSFFSRFGSSVSSGASRILFSRKRPSTTSWTTGSSSSTGNQDATAPYVHQICQLLDGNIGPLEEPQAATSSATRGSTQDATLASLSNQATPNSVQEGSGRMSENEISVDMSKAGIDPLNGDGTNNHSNQRTMTEVHVTFEPERPSPLPRSRSKTLVPTLSSETVREVEEDLEKDSISDGKADPQTTTMTNQGEVEHTSDQNVADKTLSADSMGDKAQQTVLAIPNQENFAQPPGSSEDLRVLTTPAPSRRQGQPHGLRAHGKAPNLHLQITLIDSPSRGTSGSPAGERCATPSFSPSSSTHSHTTWPSDSGAPILDPEPPRDASSMSAMLKDRPHLAEVMSAIGMGPRIEYEDDSEDDLYDPEFGIGPTSGHRRRRRGGRRPVACSGTVGQCGNYLDPNRQSAVGTPQTPGTPLAPGTPVIACTPQMPCTPLTPGTPTRSTRTSRSNSMLTAPPDESLPPAISRIPSQAVLSVAAAANIVCTQSNQTLVTNMLLKSLSAVVATLALAVSVQAQCSGVPNANGPKVRSAIDRILTNGKQAGNHAWEVNYNGVYLHCSFKDGHWVNREECKWWWDTVRGDFGGIVSDKCAYHNPSSNMRLTGYQIY